MLNEMILESPEKRVGGRNSSLKKSDKNVLSPFSQAKLEQRKGAFEKGGAFEHFVDDVNTKRARAGTLNRSFDKKRPPRLEILSSQDDTSDVT